MPEKEKKAAETLAKAVNVLPEGKVEYLLGFAEGAVAAAEKKAGSEPQEPGSESADRPA